MGFFSKLTDNGASAAGTVKDAIVKVAKAVAKALEAAVDVAADAVSKSAAITASQVFQEKTDAADNTQNTAQQKKAARKKKKKKHEWRDVKEPIKFVNQNGKVCCFFCSNPIGDFLVTSTQVKLQDTLQVTVGDRNGAPAPNLVFKGQCTYPIWRIPPPCIGVIQPGQWKDTSQTYIDDHHALLRKSTIPCTISGQDIQIVHSGQKVFIPNVKPKSIDTKFKIKIKKIDTDYFLPLGITNPVRTDDVVSDKIKIRFRIKYQAAREYEIRIFDKDSTLIWQEVFLQGVTINAKYSKKENQLVFHDPQDSEETYPVGDYTYEWDGFDTEGVYDSKRMLGGLTFKITGKSFDGKESEDEEEIEFSYAVENYVDIHINKNTKEIKVTLRVDFRDGGAKGLEPARRIVTGLGGASTYEKADWEKIPPNQLQAGRPPISSRSQTKSYAELLVFACDGASHYWSRNGTNTEGKDITVNGESYQVWTSVIDAEEQCTDDLSLVLLTNYHRNTMFTRSSNPGKARDWHSFWANITFQRVFYAVGYFHRDANQTNWGYDTESEAEEDFRCTAAHEIGHEILSAFGGGKYSVTHKGTSTFVLQKILSSSIFPSSGEVDLMKYYAGEDFTRTVAAEEDVIGLIWLSKLEID